MDEVEGRAEAVSVLEPSTFEMLLALQVPCAAARRFCVRSLVTCAWCVVSVRVRVVSLQRRLATRRSLRGWAISNLYWRVNAGSLPVRSSTTHDEKSHCV